MIVTGLLLLAYAYRTCVPTGNLRPA
jgi:hypothetical protein